MALVSFKGRRGGGDKEFGLPRTNTRRRAANGKGKKRGGGRGGERVVRVTVTKMDANQRHQLAVGEGERNECDRKKKPPSIKEPSEKQVIVIPGGEDRGRPQVTTRGGKKERKKGESESGRGRRGEKNVRNGAHQEEEGKNEGVASIRGVSGGKKTSIPHVKAQ